MRGSTARQTTGYFSGHVALGLMSAVLGPTLPALAAQLGRDPEALGILFAVRSLGYLIASLLAGRVYDRERGHPILAVALLVMAGCLAAVPWMPTRLALIGVMLMLGGAQGVLDVGNNMLIARVHGPKVAPYMNALHCAYGFGALAAPLVVGASSSVAWGYGWLAIAILPISVWVGVTPSPTLAPTPASHSASTADPRPDRRLLALLIVWFMLCTGAEAGFAGWLFTVASKTGFTDSSATALVSGFWAAFMCGRLLSIGLAVRIRPLTMLTVDLLGALVSISILVVVPGPTAMWIATLTFGLSLASLFPTAMSLASERMTLDGKVTSKLFVGASLGSMLVPWLLGYTFVLGPRGPVWMILLDLILAAVVLLAIRGSGILPAWNPRTTREHFELTTLMTPGMANFSGKVHGGALLKLLDEVAYSCAARYSGHYVVTLMLDDAIFRAPVNVGELVTFKACVNWVGSTSMEIGIRVMAENHRTRVERHVMSCFFVMLAMDDQGNKCEVPRFEPRSDDDLRRWQDADQRRAEHAKRRFRDT